MHIALSSAFRWLTGAACVLLATCATTSDPLVGTAWRLVAFESMSDTIGIIHPADATFTMRLAEDGTVTMRLDCNRATGSWSYEPVTGGSSGRFEFGRLASTRALCSPPNLDERLLRDAEFVRGYVLRNGRLYLSLMADAGVYSWEPM